LEPVSYFTKGAKSILNSSFKKLNSDVNWKNSEGDTPLLAACRRGHADTISMLLAHGADANIVSSNDGFAPLHLCAKRGDRVSIDHLLSANTNTTLTTPDGQTALDIAKSKDYGDIYGILMRQRRPIPTIQMQRRVGTASTTTINRTAQEANIMNHNSSLLNIPTVPSSSLNEMKSQDFNRSDKRDLRTLPNRKSTINERENKKATADNSLNNLNFDNSSIDINHSFNSISLKADYTIIGQQSQQDNDASSNALRKLLDCEITNRKAIENKVCTISVFFTVNLNFLHHSILFKLPHTLAIALLITIPFQLCCSWRSFGVRMPSC